MTVELDFRISSGLKDIIGKELITDDRIAIFELVKNSYDANAKETKITFQNVVKQTKEKQPRIIVSDDGNGMSYSDIVKKFLFVGYSEKKPDENEKEKDYRDKISEKRRRHFAGSKGIGRFSCDRLGKKVKMYTKTPKDPSIHTLEIDWTEFEGDQEKEFTTIKTIYKKESKLEIEGYHTQDFKHGTVLVIEELSSEWNHKKLLRLKMYLQRLINPTQVDPKLGFEINLEVPEYEDKDEEYREGDEPWNILNGPINNIVFEKMGMKTAWVSTMITEDGKDLVTELFDKDQFIYRVKEKNPYPQLYNIRTVVFFLSSSAKRTFTSIMGLRAVNYGSILLYKNGVRIHPYGDLYEDWLGLDKLKQQGYARYLGTREVIGRVEISGVQPDFIEVSSRDGGLVKNSQHEQLIEFTIKKAITPLRRFVVEGIDWDRDEPEKTELEIAEGSLQVVEKLIGTVRDKEKEVTFNPDLLDIFKKTEMERIPEVIKNVEAIKKHVKDPEAKKYIDRQVKVIRSTTRSLKKKVKVAEEKAEHAEERKKVVETENLFLKSSNLQDKEQIISLFHHIGIHSDTIKSHASRVLKFLRQNQEIPENIVTPIDSIAMLAQMINTISKIGFKGGITEEMERGKQDVIQFMYEFIKNICVSYYVNIEIEIDNKIEQEYKREFAPFELTYVVDNFISNSKKAGASKISFSLYVQEKQAIIEIVDNGKGLNPRIKNIDDIFQRTVSTTRGGAGLGLFDARKILSKMKCTISAEKIEKGFKLRIVIPHEN